MLKEWSGGGTEKKNPSAICVRLKDRVWKSWLFFFIFLLLIGRLS